MRQSASEKKIPTASARSDAAPKAASAETSAKKARAAKRAVAKPAATDMKKSDAAPPKEKKQKLVRDSFTMPKADFALIGVLKERAIGFRRPAKKTELLRAGLYALASMSDSGLRKALDALTPLAPGRPKSN